MLVTIACFCLFLGLLVTLVAARDARKDVFNRRIPPAPAKLASRVLLTGGVGLLGYSLYLRTVA
jgi:hypothetical protein